MNMSNANSLIDLSWQKQFTFDTLVNNGVTKKNFTIKNKFIDKPL